jgi:hypothetical protein
MTRGVEMEKRRNYLGVILRIRERRVGSENERWCVRGQTSSQSPSLGFMLLGESGVQTDARTQCGISSALSHALFNRTDSLPKPHRAARRDAYIDPGFLRDQSRDPGTEAYKRRSRCYGPPKTGILKVKVKLRGTNSLRKAHAYRTLWYDLAKSDLWDLI